MISVVYCTRKHNQEHIEHLKKTFGHPKVEVIEYINNGEGLTKFYKRGLEEATNNIVVFCHDDILLETKQIASKLVKMFDKNPEFGIIGVAGTKQLSESGRWWDNPKKMYGQVKHTNQGKSWLSSYSDGLGDVVEEVVLVDGLFFAVHKDRIKEDFNLEVSGFHFYDVDFCFRNYLKGVKVGVTTKVRVNHMSIGETNDEWEENRKTFAEKFKDNLPVNIKRVLRPNEKIKVLMGCLNFANLTGSELYVFELAKELVKLNCDVTVCSNIGMPLSGMAKKHGIKVVSINEPSGFKIGDGKWQLNTPQGPIVSEANKMYKVSDVDFDILHLNHKPIAEHLLKLYPNTPAINTVHSEVIPNLEEPVVDSNIKKYIAIRESIADFICDGWDVSKGDVEVIYNPIDYNRFKVINTTQKRDVKRIIFVGTIDYLRKDMILDLIKTTREDGNELWIVGKENDVKVADIKAEDGGDVTHVTYHEPTPNVERLVQQCDETAGILMGRTTIEGWLCGKAGWIYDIDSSGNILSKDLHPVPEDVNKFRSDSIAKEIKESYIEILE